MDEKTITAISTTLALMQIQINALMLLLQRQAPGVLIQEEFKALTDQGVQTVGVETMEAIKKRIKDGIVQRETGFGGNA
jgi:hypothetical protein